jgi:lysophospholipase L1-like esterase
MKAAKMTLLGIGIAILMVSSGLIMLFNPRENWFRPVKPLRVACVGDSITEGSGYPGNLRMLLGTNYTVGNFGVSGSTVSLKSGKPYMNQTAFQKAKAFQPDIVVIMLGTNDASSPTYQYLDSSDEDYKQLIGEFQALSSSPEVWLVKPPPIFNNGPGPNNTNLVQGVIPTIERVAYDLNLSTIDVYAGLANHSEYFPDGVHPDSEGAKVIADQVYEAITFTDSDNLGASDIVFLG